MVNPVDGIRAFHNAFRNEMERIDAAALDNARGKDGLSPVLGRYRFFNEVLSWHEKGEERGVFPVLETVAPLVAEAYARDHRGLDEAAGVLDLSCRRQHPVETARATAAYRFHLKMHLDREEAHLYRIFEERVPLDEQWQALGVVVAAVPQERFPEVVAWLFPLVGQNDRENMIRIYQAMLPAPAFTKAVGIIRQAVGNQWAELALRVPGLETM